MPVLLLTGFLALLSSGAAAGPASSATYSIPAPVADRRASADRLVFDAKRSTRFLNELQAFLALLPTTSPEIEAFHQVASSEGVAAAQSGALLSIAYDWIDRAQWKYFVRPEADFAGFDALFAGAMQDSIYRDIAAASLIYGGQGILDFKRTVPEAIEQLHDQQAFQSATFAPRDRRQARLVYRLAARQVETELARYRPALTYLQSRGVDENRLRQKAQAEHNPELRSILLHYAALLHCYSGVSGDDRELRIAILLSDVQLEFPILFNALMRIGERNRQVIFQANTKSFVASAAAFRFLVDKEAY